MRQPIVVLLNVLLLAALATFAAPASVQAAAPAGTQDVLHMNDGRVLYGTIIEEKDDAIVFELVHAKSGIRAKLTYLTSEIAEIERDVETDDAPAAKTARTKRSSGRATSRPTKDRTEEKRTYGATRGAVDASHLPSFYIVPMKGQMGTDIHTDVYKKMVDDIRAADPDILVIQMDCADHDDVLYSLVGREEQGLADFDEFRDLVNLFRDELSDIRQVVWVEDSVGVSSTVALAWDELYMTPDARLGGLVSLQQLGFESWSDDDVRGKMTAAFMSWVKGFLEYGGYSLVLADAMVRPQYELSGSWDGRKVDWTLDQKGEYIVDSSDKKTAEFRAKSAEDLCISDGTAETLDDLALLLGIREYRLLDGKSTDVHESYVEDWRRTLENCKTWLADHQQYMGWASGEDQLKYLGQAKGRLEKVLAAMERHGAVETRLRMEHGVNKFDIITLIEQIKEQIRAIRQAQRGGRGGGGRGGRGPGGTGGG